jgi:hypothetical protein
MNDLRNFWAGHQAGVITAVILLAVVAAGIFVALYWLGAPHE